MWGVAYCGSWYWTAQSVCYRLHTATSARASTAGCLLAAQADCSHSVPAALTSPRHCETPWPPVRNRTSYRPDWAPASSNHWRRPPESPSGCVPPGSPDRTWRPPAWTSAVSPSHAWSYSRATSVVASSDNGTCDWGRGDGGGGRSLGRPTAATHTAADTGRGAGKAAARASFSRSRRPDTHRASPQQAVYASASLASSQWLPSTTPGGDTAYPWVD